jgi:hypothetical protein
MRTLLFIFFFLPGISAVSQQTIQLNFLYGSKPAKGYKDSEAKHFGGLKGGHVNIEVNGRVLDFLPGKCPLFPDNKNPSGGYYINSSVSWDTTTTKWMTVIIPVSPEKIKRLESIMDSFAKQTPYDYAVFGMRCAAASYDVLSEIGLVKPLRNSKNVVKHFYPKLLRKKMLKWALRNNYCVIKHDGRSSRKWESDKGLF